MAAINYGAIGAIIGHEMTHGFDDTGAAYNSHGNLEVRKVQRYEKSYNNDESMPCIGKNWWSKETRSRFEAKQDCFREQYSAFSFPVLDLIPDYEGPTHVNGNLTLGENIAGPFSAYTMT